MSISCLMTSCKNIYHPFCIDISVALFDQVIEAAVLVIVNWHKHNILHFLVQVSVGEIFIIINIELFVRIFNKSKSIAFSIANS